jgi:hypothetical protein
MKVFKSLPQELEDQALIDWDNQVDQIPISPSQILENPEKHHDMKVALFYYVFGYAQAKGWTSIEKRLGLK